MDPASGDLLETALRAFDGDDSVAVAVLWGTGGAFCAGWDLKFAAELSGQCDPLSSYDYPAEDATGDVPRGPMGPTRLQLSKRSEEHTSELQSLVNLVCRLLLEKKKTTSS